MMKMNIENEIISKYTTLGDPIAYSSPNVIYQYYKKTVPLSFIKNVLSKINVYTLHRQTKRPKRNVTYVYRVS